MNVSVICPFYNESQILDDAIRALLGRLDELPHDWELIVVNDGSTDGSFEIAKAIEEEHPRLRVLGYARNRGRGHALRTGIGASTGEVIVTTEIDLSWGDDIVHELVDALVSEPSADMIVASPHLQGGGYRNVPWKRVWLSRLGNRVIRACMSNAATMNTGMTRAYRRELICSLPLSEDGKEFHLEVILKARAFGASIYEIPAILEWKDYKHQGKRVRRKSSSRVNRLIVSHSLFSIFATPVRYVWAMSFVSLGLGVAFLIVAVILAYLRMVSAYAALLSVSLVILSIVLFVMGVVLQQGNMIQRELWILQRREAGPAEGGHTGSEPGTVERRDRPVPELLG